MMKSFFDLYERQSSLALEIGHNSIAGWCVTIYDRRNATLSDARKVVFVQESSYELAIAKAYVMLCEYLSETRGGY